MLKYTTMYLKTYRLRAVIIVIKNMDLTQRQFNRHTKDSFDTNDLMNICWH